MFLNYDTTLVPTATPQWKKDIEREKVSYINHNSFGQPYQISCYIIWTSLVITFMQHEVS